MMILGDTHAAQGDSELAGTAMETSICACFSDLSELLLLLKAQPRPSVLEGGRRRAD